MDAQRWRASTPGILLLLLVAQPPSGPTVSHAPAPIPVAASPEQGADHGVLPRLRAGPAPEQARARPVWRDDELMISGRPGASLTAIAAAYGTSLRRAPGKSGYAPLRVPDGVSPEALLSRLRQDPRVASADRVGAVYGAGTTGASRASDSDSAVGLQWHLDAMIAPALDARDLSGVTVAVLDTGVAFEDVEGERTFLVAPTLADTTFVFPYDFVEDDAHPNDDHQHGTHITSLIASRGEVEGVAPGVAIMPIKVLNFENEGSEVDLVDAIHHAVEHGAHVINMSLCFSEGYAPSEALREALRTASEAGVVMVAASGNNGEQAALYPAASPLVLSVGASQLDDDGSLSAADYSNVSPTLDLLAPGGNLGVDNNGDGYVDGILAETINPADPTDIGLWFYAGTSQATALVTGAVAHLVAEGETDPGRIARALQSGALETGGFPYLVGEGAGHLDVEGALAAAAEDAEAVATEWTWHVSMLPYLKQVSSKKVRPMVALTAVDADGNPASRVNLVGSWWGSSGETTFKCKTDSDGTCTVKGEITSMSADAALAWGVSVDAAFSQEARSSAWRTAARPTGMLFVNDGAVILAEALEAEGLLWGMPLGILWDEGSDGTLGDLAESYAVVNLATGSALRPEALLFTPGAVDGVATMTEVALDLDALGLVDEELGTGTVVVMDVDGSGIESDPLGIAPISLVLVKGKGIESDPLGITSGGYNLFMRGSGIESDPLGFSGVPLDMSSGALLGSGSLSGYALGALVDDGGWLDEDGYPAATALMSSGSVGMAWDEVSLSTGAVGGVLKE